MRYHHSMSLEERLASWHELAATATEMFINHEIRNPDLEHYTIYALLDTDNTPRYVGSTLDIADRVRTHLAVQRYSPEWWENPSKTEWIRSLEGPPRYVILEEGNDYSNRYPAEVWWIRTYRDRYGAKILNIKPVMGMQTWEETQAWWADLLGDS
jgi:GIY-YIG catalytic domain